MFAFYACLQVKDYAAELIEPNHAPLSAILQPEDECQLWSDLAASSTCPFPLKQRAAAIAGIFAAFSPKLAAIRKHTRNLPEEEILDLIDEVHQTLEALWELEDGVISGQYLSMLLTRLIFAKQLMFLASKYSTTAYAAFKRIRLFHADALA